MILLVDLKSGSDIGGIVLGPQLLVEHKIVIAKEYM